MIFSTIDLFLTDPLLAVITVGTLCGALLICITFHEFSHAYVATSLGDHTARAQGRLSLNPVRHLDPIGTALIVFAGFGWGKPVPVNPFSLRIGPRHGMALVSLAGPAANILAAVLFALPLRFGIVKSGALGLSVLGETGAGLLGYVLVSLVFWNLLLAVFNLLPIAPLDGFKVVVGLLPREASKAFARLERYGPGILIAIILLGIISPNLRILSGVIRPAVNLLGIVILGRDLL